MEIKTFNLLFIIIYIELIIWKILIKKFNFYEFDVLIIKMEDERSIELVIHFFS